MFRTLMWGTAVLFGAGSNAACRVVECVPPDVSASVIAAQSVPGRPLRIHGRVLALETGAPIPAARVRLLTSDSAWRTVDTAGMNDTQISGAGSFTLEVGASGYDPGSRLLAVRGDSGVAWVALLARSRPAPRDPACSTHSAVANAQ